MSKKLSKRDAPITLRTEIIAGRKVGWNDTKNTWEERIYTPTRIFDIAKKNGGVFKVPLAYENNWLIARCATMLGQLLFFKTEIEGNCIVYHVRHKLLWRKNNVPPNYFDVYLQFSFRRHLNNPNNTY